MKPKIQPKKDSTIKDVLESYGVNVDLIFMRTLISVGVVVVISLLLWGMFKLNSPSDNDLPDYMTTTITSEVKPVIAEETYAINSIAFILDTIWIWITLPILLMLSHLVIKANAK